MSLAAPDVDGAPRRLEARAPLFARWPAVLFVAAQVVAVAWTELKLRFTWVPWFVEMIAWAAFIGPAFGARRVRLEIQGGRLLVSGKRAYSLSRGSIGEWREFGLAVRKGTVLHVGNRGRTLRIATGQVLSPEFAATARATSLVDLVVEPEGFEKLRTSILEPVAPPFAAEHEAAGARRWQLTPRRNGFRQVFQSMASMLLWSCACVLWAGMWAPRRFEVSTLGPGAQSAMTAAMAIGIIGWPLLLWDRSGRRRHALEVSDGGDVCLVDTRRGVVLAESVAGRTTATRATYVVPWWARRKYKYPVLLLRWPTGPVTCIANLDYGVRVPWTEPRPKTRRPAYLIGKPDWRALNEALGFSGFPGP